MGEHITGFVFIVVVPLLAAAAVVVALFALLKVLDRRGALSQRISAAFRRARKPGHEAGPRHYYQPYWRS